MQNCWSLALRTKKPFVSAKTWIQIQSQLTWIPFQLLFNQFIPHGIKWHNISKCLEIMSHWPTWNVNVRQILVRESTPESVAPNWPLVLKVKVEFHHLHVGESCKVVNALQR